MKQDRGNITQRDGQATVTVGSGTDLKVTDADVDQHYRVERYDQFAFILIDDSTKGQLISTLIKWDEAELIDRYSDRSIITRTDGYPTVCLDGKHDLRLMNVDVWTTFRVEKDGRYLLK